MSQTKAQLIDAVDGSIVTADLADDAVNASKLASDAVVNASVASNAAIAGSKISPDFGSQAISTTGGLSINGATVFNESGANVDFRVEGDTEPNLLFVDASADQVSIGTSAPSDVFDVVHAANAAAGISIRNTNNTQASAMAQLLIAGGDNSKGRLKIETNGAFHTIDEDSNGNLILEDNGTEALRIDSSRRFLLNMSSSVTGGKFQVNNAFNTFFSASNDTQGCVLQLEKTRATSPGTYTIVQDGDKLGELQFKGSNGSASVIGANIQAIVNGTPGSGNDLPTDLAFRTMPDGSGSTLERMRLDTGGRILSGISSSNSHDANAIFAGGGNAGNNNYGKIFISCSDTSPAANTAIGFVGFGKNSVNNHAHAFIGVYADAQHGSNDYPTRMSFHTCPDGSTSTTERIRIHNSGEASFNNGVCLGNGVTLSSANTLDDFETGTFTPLLSDNLSSGTANSYQNQSGHYTKIGNIVHIIGGIRANDISNLTSSNTLCLRGLPFAASDVTTGSGEPDMLHIPFFNNLTNVDRGLIYGRVENGVSACNLGFPTTTVQSGGNLQVSQINSGSASFFSFSATYRTGS